jgi:hypothetical protein
MATRLVDKNDCATKRRAPSAERRHADTPTRRHADTPTRRHAAADTPTRSRRHAEKLSCRGRTRK